MMLQLLTFLVITIIISSVQAQIKQNPEDVRMDYPGDIRLVYTYLKNTTYLSFFKKGVILGALIFFHFLSKYSACNFFFRGDPPYCFLG